MTIYPLVHLFGRCYLYIIIEKVIRIEIKDDYEDKALAMVPFTTPDMLKSSEPKIFFDQNTF